MRKLYLLAVLAGAIISQVVYGQGATSTPGLQRIPSSYKWLSNNEVAFTYDGSYVDDQAFSLEPKKYTKKTGIKAPFKFTQFPIRPQGAVNLTYSPDSTMLAFTRSNDLYVVDIATGKESRITFDGTDLILNGYASWVYYEEILGRASQYKAFWWSPDSKKIGFYRFDNTNVPMFPIYSPFGQDGSLRQTRYPKCGENNPEVKIGIAEIDGVFSGKSPKLVWADFDEKQDQYFGIPFWGADSQRFFIAREPRTQNTLDLYAVSAADGSKEHIYHETYKTWLDWIEGMVFAEKGLYMVRSFETGWQQIYFLSYDGKTLKRLTDGPNWRVNIVKVDEKKGDVFFVANRESTVRKGLYKVDAKGVITSLTDPSMTVSGVSFSPDGKNYVASLSNFKTPSQIWLCSAEKPSKKFMVANQATEDFNLDDFLIPEMVTMTTHDGLVLPAYIVYPKNFDPSKKYPVHMDIYGGPDTPQVSERWMGASASFKFYSDNDIIEITADCRASGHNGHEGLDQIYRQLDQVEVEDFVEWAKWLQAKPYVKGDKIGVEGFSFGGTMTSLLVMDHPEAFHYGIAGGGVYDWALYDTHYTERFMDTPQNNPEGYARTKAVDHAKNYVTKNDGKVGVEPVMLKITHGTGDDNVHYQNTLQLIDALHKENAKFDFMVYPDGMHGYRGYQGTHFQSANREFWLKYLLSE